jgi:hypothetical protein
MLRPAPADRRTFFQRADRLLRHCNQSDGERRLGPRPMPIIVSMPVRLPLPLSPPLHFCGRRRAGDPSPSASPRGPSGPNGPSGRAAPRRRLRAEAKTRSVGAAADGRRSARPEGRAASPSRIGSRCGRGRRPNGDRGGCRGAQMRRDQAHLPRRLGIEMAMRTNAVDDREIKR